MEEQFDKSEQATPFKLKEARKKGQIAKSIEFPAFFSLLAMSCVMVIGLSEFAFSVTAILRAWILNASFLALNSGVFFAYVMEYVSELARFFLQIVLTGIVAYIATSLIYAGPVFSAHPVKPDMSRINPAKGIKRLFSRRTLVEFAKLIIKLLLFVFVFRLFFYDAYPLILDSNKAVLSDVLLDWARVSAKFVLYLLFVFLLSALFDLWYSKRDFARQMKMSTRDVKDEHKKREGSPEVKQKQKRNQNELLSKLTSMQNLKEADVIVTNPTHIAIALKYRPKEMALPIVLTKGRGLLATTIMSKGRSCRVPVIRNISLARHLYKTVKVGQPIDTESNEPVAKIYKWVISMPDNKVFPK